MQGIAARRAKVKKSALCLSSAHMNPQACIRNDPCLTRYIVQNPLLEPVGDQSTMNIPTCQIPLTADIV